MTSDVPLPPATEGTESHAGRKPKAAVSDKIATLEARLAAAKAEAREAARARATIVGLAVVEAMKDDPDFARQMAALLKARVKGARDKASIAELLI